MRVIFRQQLNNCSTVIIISPRSGNVKRLFKKTSTLKKGGCLLAGAEGLEVAPQPLLRYPKSASRDESHSRLSTAALRRAPFSRPPAAVALLTRHAPRASGIRFCLPAKNSRCFRNGSFWQGQKDLNPRHAVLETAALPTELYPYMVGLQGLEPRTNRL